MSVPQLVALEPDPRLAVGPIDRERLLELLAVVVHCPNPETKGQRHPNCWLGPELSLLVLLCPKQSVMVYLQVHLQRHLVLPMLLVMPAVNPTLVEQRQCSEQDLELR
jgi:hypothetical protein